VIDFLCDYLADSEQQLIVRPGAAGHQGAIPIDANRQVPGATGAAGGGRVAVLRSDLSEEDGVAGVAGSSGNGPGPVRVPVGTVGAMGAQCSRCVGMGTEETADRELPTPSFFWQRRAPKGKVAARSQSPGTELDQHHQRFLTGACRWTGPSWSRYGHGHGHGVVVGDENGWMPIGAPQYLIEYRSSGLSAFTGPGNVKTIWCGG